MTALDDELKVAATGSTATSSVPMSYAERAMGSLMQLHTELMNEKEQRVEMYKTLMRKEQDIAELRAHVRLLEERLTQNLHQVRPVPTAMGEVPFAPKNVTTRVPSPQATPVVPPKIVEHQPSRSEIEAPPISTPHTQATDVRRDGWKTW